MASRYGDGTKGGGASVPLAMLNANKRGITLDLKHRDGKRLLRDMVRRADVLIENFAPGVMDRLELGYERLTRINPRPGLWGRAPGMD